MSIIKVRVKSASKLFGDIEIRPGPKKSDEDYQQTDAQLIFSVLENCVPSGTLIELQKILNDEFGTTYLKLEA